MSKVFILFMVTVLISDISSKIVLKSQFGFQRFKPEDTVSRYDENNFSKSKIRDDKKLTLSDILENYDSNSINEPNPDEFLTTPELIQKYGYGAESHKVTTEDGYILTLHRIPSKKKTTKVVFLQHGMFGTSADWVLNSVDKSLAYLLSNAGYDVWLGNCRGNQYSQNHQNLSTDSIKFWKFSWHEMGYYDMAAEINYVLNATGVDSLSYVGHSMGTTMFFVLMSTRPEYNKKVNFMAALGPAVYLSHTKSSAKYFATFYGRTERIILDIVGHGVFLPKFITKVLKVVGPEFCTPAMKIDELCEEAMFLIAGHDPAQTNYTQLPVILAHVPSTVSTQTGFHYFQIIRSGEFTMFDHGAKNNFEKYGSKTAPAYDLSQVKVPVAIFWGQNDILCDPLDVDKLAKVLPNKVGDFRVNFTEFNHIDFIFAKDADVLVNLPLIDLLNTYNSK